MGKAGPLIGVTSNFHSAPKEYYLPSAYLNAVMAAGGVPIILPYGSPEAANDYLALVDGLLLTGGTDFTPELYGGQHHPKTSEILEERDRFEIDLVRKALAMDMPVLAICRGMQLVNVLRGGTIYDDTLSMREQPTEDHRDGRPIGDLAHQVTIRQGTKLATICLAETAEVNSLHHQAVDKVGDGLVVSAEAPDGVIEAIEDPEHPFLLGIQWHPEHLQKDPAHKRIMDAFIAACRENAVG